MPPQSAKRKDTTNGKRGKVNKNEELKSAKCRLARR